MKHPSYLTRAQQSRDPRFADILGRLGYRDAANELAPNSDTEPGEDQTDASNSDVNDQAQPKPKAATYKRRDVRAEA